MAIGPGSRLGPYEVTALIGEGGMGKVWRARHTALKRDDALKVLPETFASDPDRLARFQREAQVLASLNHPNIAHVYGLEHTDGVQALVMELVEGPTLADRIAQGAIPVDEALPIAKQIAEALEAAHERGIIHRDLKPANIKVRSDGTVKVLDFGLAKALEPVSATIDASQSPTITRPAMMTGVGVLLGTAAYMSPEQAHGKAVDKRSDIWAFGCVLYEMLSGNRAFEGEDVADTFANVLKEQPHWDDLPDRIPPQLQRLLRRCLAKDRRERLRDIGDVHLELKDLAAGGADGAQLAGAPVRARRRERLAWALAATIGVGALVAGVTIGRSMRSTAPTAVLEFTIPPPTNATFGGIPGGGTGVAPQIAVSPDGRHVVFVAASNGVFTLWLRSLGSLDARELAGTDQAAFPFWSPDSRFIGFFAGGKLKRVPLDGGSPLVVCDSVGGRGGTWNQEGVIVFAPSVSALQRVSAAGGVPAPVTTLDGSQGETAHRWPHFLPDGRHFFYTTVAGPLGTAPRPSQVKIGSLDSSDTLSLFAAESAVSYSLGHLLFWRDGNLMAQPFDADTRRLSGELFPVAQQVIAEGLRYVSASVSPTGILIYATRSTDALAHLTWRDRTGTMRGTVAEPAGYTNVALAPDDRRVAVSLPVGGRGSSIPGVATDIWLIDLEQSSSKRVTFARGNNAFPVWSPNGDRIAFFSSRPDSGIYQVATNGAGKDELLLAGPGAPNPSDWSPDGRFIAFTQANAQTGSDVMILPLTGDRTPFVFSNEPYSQYEATFAPDGRWIAYTTIDVEMGAQVFVQPFPATGGQYQVSRNGGAQPTWRADGKELFFLTPDGKMMAVAVDTHNGFEAGNPEPLFDAGVSPGTGWRQYAVTRDGQRFLINVPQGSSNTTSLTVVTNWPATIRE